MTTTKILILNFEEIRRRSVMVWNGLPPEFFQWKSDKTAESFSEVIRHVLECERLFHTRILARGPLADYASPWKERPFVSVEAELKFAEPYRKEFLEMIGDFSERDLDDIVIGKEHPRKLGDYLLRTGYHEAVHTGEFLSNLRTLDIDRPYIWD